ncbi:MAG: hypothetical protein HKM94_00360 [Halobacteria archaeon]|nr:hypothetical protein [Halobacteria archaeon]
MLENILGILKSIATAYLGLKAFSEMRAKAKGDARSLVEELKESSRLCRLIIEEDVILGKSFPSYPMPGSILMLKHKKIRKYPQLLNSDLASWTGKSTHTLVDNIYDKIKNLKTTYKYAPQSEKRRWKARVINIQKRILLLVKHLRD